MHVENGQHSLNRKQKAPKSSIQSGHNDDQGTTKWEVMGKYYKTTLLNSAKKGSLISFRLNYLKPYIAVY